jgi:predicted nucleic acid-binding protein
VSGLISSRPTLHSSKLVNIYPKILKNRGIHPEIAMTILESLSAIVQIVDADTYGSFEAIARERLSRRDEDDWPILATALALRCPIWTEDTDFFGCGVATWTTDRVKLYFTPSVPSALHP